MISLKKKVIQGSLWTIGGYGTSQLLRLGSHLILAWLLAPQVFGLMTLVSVVHQGLGMFSDVGILPSIIQSERGDEPDFLNTAWTIQIIRGILLWIVTCAVTWPIATLYAQNDPYAWQLIYLLPVTGIGAILQGFSSTALATLNRQLQLGKKTLLEFGTQIVSLTVMIVWAFISPSVWAMVAGGLAGSIFRLIVSHLIIPGYRVRFCWEHDSVNELVRFGKWIFLSTAGAFLARNFDKLILGTLLSLTQLGLYNLAHVFAMVGLFVCTHLSTSVLFPLYSKFRSKPEHMISIALRARKLVLWIGLVLCIGLAVGAPLFFEKLWDPRYHSAGKIVQWLAGYIWMLIIMMTMDRIPLALGNSKAMFIANCYRSSGIILAFIGYMFAQLFGFTVGLTFGPIIAHLYLVQQIPVQRRAILLQGVRFTLGGYSYAIPAVYITNYLHRNGSDWLWLLTVFIFVALPLLAALRPIWQEIRS